MKKLSIITLISGTLSLTTPGNAADMSSLSMLTADISTKLAQIQKADFVETTPMPTMELQPRQLRHVYMQARKNQRLIQSLKFINGLEVMPLPEMQTKNWDESDIEKSLQTQLADLKELNTIFTLDMDIDGGAGNATDPTSLFKSLLQIQDQLLSLGIPGQSPYVSYQYATLIVEELKKISEAKNAPVPDKDTAKIEAKTPKDNYQYAQSVVAELQYMLTEYAKIDIPGGVTVPNSKEGKISSSDVIFLLQSLLSEIVAVKITMNDTSPLQLPPIEEGRTPSDVYGQLEYAYNIIYALEDALAS